MLSLLLASRLLLPIATEAQRQRVPVPIALRVSWMESRWRTNARGRAGEVGVFQVLPQSGRTWCRGVKWWTLQGNIECGVRLLALAHRRCPKHPATAYNAPSRCGESSYERKINGTN